MRNRSSYSCWDTGSTLTFQLHCLWDSLLLEKENKTKWKKKTTKNWLVRVKHENVSELHTWASAGYKGASWNPGTETLKSASRAHTVDRNTHSKHKGDISWFISNIVSVQTRRTRNHVTGNNLTLGKHSGGIKTLFKWTRQFDEEMEVEERWRRCQSLLFWLCWCVWTWPHEERGVFIVL